MQIERQPPLNPAPKIKTAQQMLYAAIARYKKRQQAQQQASKKAS